MTQKAIIDVEINDGPFRDFHALFQDYQKKLESMPEDWAKVTGAIDDAGSGMGDFSKSSKSSKEFLMIAAVQADAISKAMNRATGVQDKFNTRAKDGAIQMTRMQKASAAMHKSISGMSSVLLKLGTVGASGIGSAIGAIYGATSMLAGQNLQARGLGLRIGQTQAFGANFEKFGLGASDLGNVANAQGDVSKWRAFIAAGLTPQQVQNEDAEQLTYDFARAASGKYREWQKSGKPAASMAQAYGFTDMLSLQQLRTGASYGDSDWVKAQQKEMADAKRNEIDQGTADQASDVKAALKSDWAQVMNEFNGQLAKMSPELETMGKAAAAAAVNLLKVAGPEAKAVMAALEGPPVSREQAASQGGVVSGLARMGYGIRDFFSGSGGTLAAPNLDSILDAQLQMESAGGKHLLSPKGAKGPYQFMDATWKDWGHGDVNDPKASRDAARRYDTFLLKRYGGDVKKAMAAYNWGMGNLDKDIATHGKDWEKYAPKESQGYNAKLMQLLLQKGQNVNININNSTTANVSTSMNAAAN
ncbi:lytic transglycosylase domain-containing protein [Paraburkholderia dilworthii]|uniref:lytic transglycosylase domain-containing protein n=1 Tax=Paraburkholderia dilworthii TaxID=948106 RepID=UPI0004870562|nr:lytic transglycosylase domain-containing protein [Paraburkholderia dilworthii]